MTEEKKGTGNAYLLFLILILLILSEDVLLTLKKLFQPTKPRTMPAKFK